MNRYLKTLGVKDVGEKSLQQIVDLTKAHLHTFPFELISKYTLVETDLNGRIPSVADFIERFELHGWGGNCHILNGRFVQLLDWLGYDVQLVPVEKGHVAIWLKWEGKEYLVDVGYAGPFFEPIPIMQGKWTVETPYETSYFDRQDDGAILWERVRDGKQIVTKTIYLRPLTEEEFYWWVNRSYSDIPENSLFRKVEITWYPNEERHQLMNTVYTIDKPTGERVIKTYEDEEEWVQLIESTFGISRKSTEKALEFLRERGVELFPVLY
ncbi:hypothetical protein GCM10008967_31060 [Bacillus carboniphilus]|uniref:Arylamine N-acetyltransferase n=1 Tax=Bacillus carboniphilus TaxID=86663 RepID=A0ABP3G8W4_9BACI